MKFFLGYLCQKVNFSAEDPGNLTHKSLFYPIWQKANSLLNSYLDLHNLQGGMKFATQISPLLNSVLFVWNFWHLVCSPAFTKCYFVGLIRSHSRAKTSIFPVPFRVPGHFGDGSGFVEGDTGLVQVRDDNLCPGSPVAVNSQPGINTNDDFKDFIPCFHVYNCRY